MFSSPAKTEAAAGEPPTPLADPRERLTAAHEAGHAVIAMARCSTVRNVQTLRADTLLDTGDTTARGICQHDRPDPVVSFSGCIGACLVSGIPYRFATTWEARIAACDRRATVKERMASPAPHPEPGSTIPGSWDAVPTDPPALALYLHSGRGSDLANAVEYIEAATEETDHAEYLYAVEAEWDCSQNQAFRLCSEWLPEIRDLAGLLCERGGSLTEGEIATFWKGARQSWAMRLAEKHAAKLKRKRAGPA